jgi:signal transduction histidine kinase
LDTHEDIPESAGTSEITEQNLKISSSSTKQHNNKALPFHMITWLFKWFQANTFAPGFLSGIWSQPIFGYVVACVGQLSFHNEPFELDSLIRGTVEDVQAATLSHQFLIEGETGMHISGDKDRLEQVFVNLLTNAVKYSPKTDKVLVSLSHTQEEAIVCVKDFGIGIADVHHQKIFERFYQVTDPLEKTYPGLGMGLYISHEIVNRHHGHMWVESRKGEGATFYIALPVLQVDNLESPGINIK